MHALRRQLIASGTIARASVAVEATSERPSASQRQAIEARRVNLTGPRTMRAMSVLRAAALRG